MNANSHSEWMHGHWRVIIIGTFAILALWIWTGHDHGSAPSNSPQLGKFETAVNQIQGTVDRLAQIQAASKFAQPAVSVVHDVVGGQITAGQWQAILHAAGGPKYVPAYSAKLAVATPKPSLSPPPGWTLAQGQFIEDATANGVRQVINDPTTHIPVTITQVPAPTSRIGTDVFSNGDAGLSYAVKRRGQLDFDALLLEHGKTIEPGLGISYQIKGTQLGFGIGAIYGQKKFIPGFHFTLGI